MLPGVYVETMGSVAGGLGLIGFVPQGWQTVRRGTAGDLNLGTLVIFAANTALWALYGMLMRGWALAVSDGLILLLIGILLAYKIRDRRRARTAT